MRTRTSQYEIVIREEYITIPVLQSRSVCKHNNHREEN